MLTQEQYNENEGSSSMLKIVINIKIHLLRSSPPHLRTVPRKTLVLLILPSRTEQILLSYLDLLLVVPTIGSSLSRACYRSTPVPHADLLQSSRLTAVRSWLGVATKRTLVFDFGDLLFHVVDLCDKGGTSCLSRMSVYLVILVVLFRDLRWGYSRGLL